MAEEITLIANEAKSLLQSLAGSGGLRELVRYFGASLLGLGADVTTLFVLVQYLHVGYLGAGAAAFLCGLVVVYLLSVWWVFTQRSLHSGLIEFAIFGMVGLLGLAVNELALWVGSEFFTLPLYISKACSVCLVFGWNFSARKALLFKA